MIPSSGGVQQPVSQHASVRERAHQDFARLHGIFVEHMTYAVTLAWAAALVAAWYAPWVRDIRGLIGSGRPESTISYLFGLPTVMTVALFLVARHPDLLRRTALLKNQAVEFACAGAVVFGAFCLSLQHAVTAYSLGG